MNADSDALLARTRAIDLKRLDLLLVAAAAFLLTLMIWAEIAVIEEQIRATGTVIVSSRSQVVQSVDGGSLKVLHVKEGQQVQAGDLIAELDPVRLQASTDEITAKMIGLQATIERLTAEVTEQPLQFSKAILAYPNILSSQSVLYDKRRRAQQEELTAISKSGDLAQQELDLMLKLASAGDASQSEVLKAQRQVNDLRAQQANKHNGFRQDAQLELAKVQSELAQTEQVFAQRHEALTSTQLRAPMSGIVKNVRYTTLGAVLKAGDELLQIVPSDDALIIEARVKPSDVAFLRHGLRANVKLDAYDYTLYGALKGEVIYISPDTLEEDLKRDEKPYYRVHIRTDSNAPNGQKALEVRPGMTASVEIITGSRTIANFVLKPLRRTVDEALHER
jgi:adhesin transport system membrane fusion protein